MNQYWGFQTGAGDSPTLPVVTFQLLTLPLYEEFVRLLEEVSPPQAAKLPPDAAAIQAKGVKRLIRDIREIFESEPLIAENMLQTLDSSEPRSDDVKNNGLLKSLIKMYAAPNSRYINYYGPLPARSPPYPITRRCSCVTGRLGTNNMTLRAKSFSWDFRKPCWPIEKTAFIRYFRRPVEYLSAGWKLRQRLFQISSKIPL